MSSCLLMCAYTMLHTFFYNYKKYFWLRQLIAIPVWAQLCCECQGEDSLPKVVFHRRSSSTEVCPPLKVVFHQSLSTTDGRLPSKAIFHRRPTSTIVCLPPKVIFLSKLVFTKSCLPPKVVFHPRLFDLIQLSLI